MKQTFEGLVLWFDNLSGQGQVRNLETGERHWLYACNIKGKKTWFEHTASVYHVEGQIIQCYLSEHLLVSDTQGELDVEKWNRIKDQNLAFRCNDEGQATTGLFA